MGFLVLSALHSTPTKYPFTQSILSGIPDFPNYYMVAKEGSNVTSGEYLKFCDDVGISYDIKYPSSKIINKNMID